MENLRSIEFNGRLYHHFSTNSEVQNTSYVEKIRTKKLSAKKVKNKKRELGTWSLKWRGIKSDAETLYSKSLSLQVSNGVMGSINSGQKKSYVKKCNPLNSMESIEFNARKRPTARV